MLAENGAIAKPHLPHNQKGRLDDQPPFSC